MGGLNSRRSLRSALKFANLVIIFSFDAAKRNALDNSTFSCRSLAFLGTVACPWLPGCLQDHTWRRFLLATPGSVVIRPQAWRCTSIRRGLWDSSAAGDESRPTSAPTPQLILAPLARSSARPHLPSQLFVRHFRLRPPARSMPARPRSLLCSLAPRTLASVCTQDHRCAQLYRASGSTSAAYGTNSICSQRLHARPLPLLCSLAPRTLASVCKQTISERNVTEPLALLAQLMDLAAYCRDCTPAHALTLAHHVFPFYCA